MAIPEREGRLGPRPVPRSIPRPVPQSRLRPFQIPTSWSVTHPTEGMEGGGWQGAHDFTNLKPGTPLLAPVGGRVIYFKPQGALGGGSMMFQGNDGRTYWLGHIAGGRGHGSVIRRGQPLARIAPPSRENRTPHLHIDARYT